MILMSRSTQPTLTGCFLREPKCTAKRVLNKDSEYAERELSN